MQRIARLGKATAAAAAFFGVWGLGAPALSSAQVTPQQGPVAVDTVVVEGNQRLQAGSIVGLFGIQPRSEVTWRDVQRGIKQLLSSGQFLDVIVRARGTPPVELVVEVVERPQIRRIQINGLENVSSREVRDTSGLRPAFPYNPQRVFDAKKYIRQELAEDGIPFAQIDERVVPVGDDGTEVDIFLDVVEGQRVTIAQVDFVGQEALTAEDLAGAMSTKQEGFWWFRSGSFDEAEFRDDLEGKLPQMAASRGYLDFRVVSDTVIIDPTSGKARVEVLVDEGRQYRLGSFTVNGNSRFPTEELEAYFERGGGGILSSLGIGGGDDVTGPEGDVFDSQQFNDAILAAEERYRNEGYLYARINPVVTRREAEEEGGDPLVDVSWEIQEGAPALVNRVSIAGNEYTYEWVIRNQIFILPGDVYSQDRVLRSYQNISSLGFFEAPMPFPSIVPNDDGDVDITFNVVEKQTGSINFGTSVGGGVGLSGFLGYQQPNLFGQAKSGSLRWDFGRYLNSFEVSYTDPAVFQSLVSGSLSLFNSRDRFFQFSTGRRRRIGATSRFGFPWPSSRVTRAFIGYGISRTKYELFNDADDTSLFGRPPGVQSQMTLGLTRQTLDHPLFPTVGSRQNVNLELNGGLLGGDGQFTRVLADANWWVPLGSTGGQDGAPGGVRLALGMTLKSGAIFGDASAFPFDRFWMGGVQFGQNLRGYDETSITPEGFFPERSAGITDIDRLGNAFFTMTTELAMRMGDQLGISLFYDAGNVWRDPTEFDPTRLFRGAGVGMSLVTPFGPIGLDYAYGFDKATPGWQLHFRMGPGF